MRQNFILAETLEKVPLTAVNACLISAKLFIISVSKVLVLPLGVTGRTLWPLLMAFSLFSLADQVNEVNTIKEDSLDSWGDVADTCVKNNFRSC